MKYFQSYCGGCSSVGIQIQSPNNLKQCDDILMQDSYTSRLRDRNWAVSQAKRINGKRWEAGCSTQQVHICFLNYLQFSTSFPIITIFPRCCRCSHRRIWFGYYSNSRISAVNQIINFYPQWKNAILHLHKPLCSHGGQVQIVETSTSLEKLTKKPKWPVYFLVYTVDCQSAYPSSFSDTTDQNMASELWEGREG